MNIIKSCLLTAAIISGTCAMQAETRILSLEQAIGVAADSSLTAFKNRHLYAAGFWEWTSYRAARLPSVSMNLTPAKYYRYITQRYDYEQNLDVYRPQQIYSAAASVQASQNVDFLGGTLFAETSLEYMRNLGNVVGNQYAATPMRVGYRQDLVGFNQFKWERRIEPLKYETVKREFIANMEALSEDVVQLYFNLALLQSEMELAENSRQSADTLFALGQQKFAIAAISQAELLTLKLDMVNARNNVENLNIRLTRARMALAQYLGLPRATEIRTVLPVVSYAPAVDPEQAVNCAMTHNPALMTEECNVLEAEKEYDKARVNSWFNANVYATVGYNQVDAKFSGAYANLMRQDVVQVGVSIPLLDWGVRRGQRKVAQSRLELARTQKMQRQNSVEDDVRATVADYNNQAVLVSSAQEAMDIAEVVYAQTLERFKIGKSDLNSLILATTRRQDAARNYVSSVQNYYQSYYRLRRLTLFDFRLGLPIEKSFDASL